MLHRNKPSLLCWYRLYALNNGNTPKVRKNWNKNPIIQYIIHNDFWNKRYFRDHFDKLHEATHIHSRDVVYNIFKTLCLFSDVCSVTYKINVWNFFVYDECPHITGCIIQKLQNLESEVSDYPSYIPDISDFHFFPSGND